MDKPKPAEPVFERIRQNEYPDRPSRSECIFLCLNVESMRHFLNKTKRRYDLIYEVELVDPDATPFETDYTLVRNVANQNFMDSLARKYWNPDSVDELNKEVLVNSDVRIIKSLPR